MCLPRGGGLGVGLGGGCFGVGGGGVSFGEGGRVPVYGRGATWRRAGTAGSAGCVADLHIHDPASQWLRGRAGLAPHSSDGGGEVVGWCIICIFMKRAWRNQRAGLSGLGEGRAVLRLHMHEEGGGAAGACVQPSSHSPGAERGPSGAERSRTRSAAAERGPSPGRGGG